MRTRVKKKARSRANSDDEASEIGLICFLYMLTCMFRVSHTLDQR